MAVNDKGELESGADSRQRLVNKKGEVQDVGAGIFISNDPNYVTDYYSARETSEDAKDLLIKYEFDEADIKRKTTVKRITT